MIYYGIERYDTNFEKKDSVIDFDKRMASVEELGQKRHLIG